MNEQEDATPIEEPENTLPAATLDSLPDGLREATERAGWDKLMPVQASAIPYLLAGKDLMVQSRTGSGKTGAFILPLLEKLDPQEASCQALILVPTRELAQQVAREARTLAGDDTLRVVEVFGGVGYGPQIEGFKAGPHIVVGTPGRILDHLLKRSLSLDTLRVLIFDEADRMLSMGFYPDMKQLQRFLPKKKYDAHMFSATFPPRVKRLAGQFLDDPEVLSLSQDHVHVTEVEHVYYEVPALDKDRCLVRLIEIENPDSAIIFCNTKSKVHYVNVVLQRFGYDADELSSDLAQGAREKVLERVRNGKLRFLVATDVAARGIDIPMLSHVFQYEPPEDSEAYIHRAGRTGRAGASGVAIALVSGMEGLQLKQIAKEFKIDVELRPMPSDEDVADVVSQRTVALLESKRRDRDKLQTERMQRFLSLARSLGEDSEEADLIAMLIDDFYQSAQHGITLFDEAASKPKSKQEHEGKKEGGKRSRRPRRNNRR